MTARESLLSSDSGVVQKISFMNMMFERHDGHLSLTNLSTIRHEDPLAPFVIAFRHHALRATRTMDAGSMVLPFQCSVASWLNVSNVGEAIALSLIHI